LVQAGLVDKPWPTPISVPNTSFNFESTMASSIKKEELFGYLDGREIGHGLFSDSPLTSPEPTPPTSPAQQPTLLDSQDRPSIDRLSPPDSQVPGHSASAAADPSGTVKKAGKKYCSSKIRSHAKGPMSRGSERLGISPMTFTPPPA
jgi:hypothetical protein